MDNRITIISNNCWGAEAYIEQKLPYNTPFVGLFVPPACFIKFCNNIQYYLSQPLKFVQISKYSMYNKLQLEKAYPLALLDNIEIHFLHYKDANEAETKWNRRLSRLNMNTKYWRIKGCDREIEDMDEYKKLWNQIAYKKVFFSSKKYNDLDDMVFISEFVHHKEVIDGKALYNISKRYFDLNSWINTGIVKVPFKNKVYSKVKQTFS